MLVWLFVIVVPVLTGTNLCLGLQLVASAVGFWSSPRSNSTTLHAHDRLLSAVLCHGDFVGHMASQFFWCHGDAGN